MSIPLAYLTVGLQFGQPHPLAINGAPSARALPLRLWRGCSYGLCLALTLIVVWRIVRRLHRKARHSYLVGGLGMLAHAEHLLGRASTFTLAISVLFGLSPGPVSLPFSELGEPGIAPGKLVGMAFGFMASPPSYLPPVMKLAGRQAVLGYLSALLFAVTLYSASVVGIKRIGDDGPPLATTAGACSLQCRPIRWRLVAN